MEGARPTLVTLALRQFWRASRGMTLGVRVAAMDRDGKVCLVRHTYVDGLHFPGGGVERGETIFVAARKELLQETGLAAPLPAFRLEHIFLNRRFPGDHVALLTVREPRQVGKPDGREIREVVWVATSSPPDDVTPATGKRLMEIVDGGPYDDYWT